MPRTASWRALNQMVTTYTQGVSVPVRRHCNSQITGQVRLLQPLYMLSTSRACCSSGARLLSTQQSSASQATTGVLNKPLCGLPT